MDFCGHQRGFLSLEWTLVDVEKRGVSKGGLDTRCLLVFARVLFVLEMALCKLRCSNAPQLSVKSQFWISSLLR